jgi:hypothetical protein
VSDGIRFEHRMSDGGALMWHDDSERATRLIPRVRQRVVSNPYSIAPPRWEVDPHFDRKMTAALVEHSGDAEPTPSPLGRLDRALRCHAGPHPLPLVACRQPGRRSNAGTPSGTW